MFRSRISAAVAAAFVAAGGSAVSAATVVTPIPVGPITFESAGDYANNFRELYDNGGRLAQTVIGAGNDYLAETSSGSGTAGDNGIAIFDQTPADATDVNVFTSPFRVSLKGRAAQGGSSIGIFLIDPANLNNNVLALVNVDNGGTTNEQIRFFRDASLNVAEPVGPGTQVGISSSSGGTVTGNNLLGQSGVDAGATFGDFVLDYSTSGTTPTLTLSFGGLSGTSAFAAGDAIASPMIAIRLFDASSAAGTTDVDDFAVNAVPEPGTIGLAGAVALAGLTRRRRRRA